MLPLANVEVTAQQSVDVQQHVAIKSGGDFQRIVVGGLQHGGVLDQIYANQQTALPLAGGVNLTQKWQRSCGGKVAYAAAGVEKQAATCANLIGQVQA